MLVEHTHSRIFLAHQKNTHQYQVDLWTFSELRSMNLVYNSSLVQPGSF